MSVFCRNRPGIYGLSGAFSSSFSVLVAIFIHEASFCQRLRLRPPAIDIAVMKAAFMRGRQFE